jgi:hypothetical protein
MELCVCIELFGEFITPAHRLCSNACLIREARIEIYYLFVDCLTLKVEAPRFTDRLEYSGIIAVRNSDVANYETLLPQKMAHRTQGHVIKYNYEGLTFIQTVYKV